MTIWLNQPGYAVNPKWVRRLMQVMGLAAIYPKPRTTVAAPGHKVYPYLSRNVAVVRPNQIWGADITYIHMVNGFIYLFAILDWYSRYVMAWQLSNSLEGAFC
jgi:putative transposase